MVLVYQLDLGWSSLAGFGVSNNDTASIKRTKWKTPFHMTCKLGQFDVVELMVNGKFRVFKYQFEYSTCERNDSVAILIRLYNRLNYMYGS